MTRSELIAIWPPTATAARKAGHEPMSPLKAIRAKCFECSYYQVSEIRRCEAIGCPLWPFHAGRHPWWLEAEKTCQTLADSDQETALQNGGMPS